MHETGDCPSFAVEICVLGLVPVLKLILFGILLATYGRKLRLPYLAKAAASTEQHCPVPLRLKGVQGCVYLRSTDVYRSH